MSRYKILALLATASYVASGCVGGSPTEPAEPADLFGCSTTALTVVVDTERLVLLDVVYLCPRASR